MHLVLLLFRCCSSCVCPATPRRCIAAEGLQNTRTQVICSAGLALALSCETEVLPERTFRHKHYHKHAAMRSPIKYNNFVASEVQKALVTARAFKQARSCSRSLWQSRHTADKHLRLILQYALELYQRQKPSNTPVLAHVILDLPTSHQQ
jgi:hypothetical protein